MDKEQHEEQRHDEMPGRGLCAITIIGSFFLPIIQFGWHASNILSGVVISLGVLVLMCSVRWKVLGHWR